MSQQKDIRSGRMVRVYQDPETRQKPEGTAEIIRVIGPTPWLDDIGAWMDCRVLFESGDCVTRAVHADDLLDAEEVHDEPDMDDYDGPRGAEADAELCHDMDVARGLK